MHFPSLSPHGLIPVVLAALSLCTAVPVRAQLLVTRAQLPALRDTSARARFLGFADLQHAPASARSEASWHYRLGVDVALAQVGPVEVAASLGHELASTAENTTGFDPRGTTWTEQLALRGWTASDWRWEASGFMRCRHDVDSGVPVDSGEQRARQRVIAIPGLGAGIATPERRFGALRARAVSTVEFYAGPTDTRAPVNRRPPRWSQALLGWSSTAQVAVPGPRGSEWYARGWGALLLFREPETAFYANHRLEVGLRLPGAARDIDLLAATERQVDDMLLPAPRATRLTLFGLRLSSHALH